MRHHRKYFILFVCVFIFGSAYFSNQSFESIRSIYESSFQTFYDAKNEKLLSIRTDFQKRRVEWTGLKDISKELKLTILKSEDRRFFFHFDVDPYAVFRVITHWLPSQKHSQRQGASTLTMQLAKLLYRDRYLRLKNPALKKIWQMAVAICLEMRWSKNEIFEAYLNLAYFSGEIQGIGAAAEFIFQKKAQDLSVQDAQILANWIRNPTENPTARNFKKPLNLPNRFRPGFHLAQSHAKNSLSSKGVKLFISKTDEEQIYEIARSHLQSLKSSNVNQAAVLVLENKTGSVVSYIANAGLDFYYVDGIKSPRQAGSTLKPFLYAASFEKGFLQPESIIEDKPVAFPQSGQIYTPDNFSHLFHGLVSARFALANSLNIPAVMVLDILKVEPFIERLRQVGFKIPGSDDFYGHSLALGSVDVTLWELTNAYRVLANLGRYSPATIVESEKSDFLVSQVITPKAAEQVISILSDNAARSFSFGQDNPLVTPFFSAAKTGTSKDMRDNWCVGFTSEWTVGVWVGNFDGSPMGNVSGVTGAAPIWNQVIHFFNEKKPSKDIIPNDFISNNSRSQDSTLAKISEQAPDRFSYPVNGMVIASDPDAPFQSQKIAIDFEGDSTDINFKLNDSILANSSIPMFDLRHGTNSLKAMKNSITLSEIKFFYR